MSQEEELEDLPEEMPEWRVHWKDMPEYEQEAQKPFATLTVRLETQQDFEEFSKLMEQRITPKTKSIWFPAKSHWGNGSNKTWISND